METRLGRVPIIRFTLEIPVFLWRLQVLHGIPQVLAHHRLGLVRRFLGQAPMMARCCGMLGFVSML